jgi:hypothetical protein
VLQEKVFSIKMIKALDYAPCFGILWIAFGRIMKTEDKPKTAAQIDAEIKDTVGSICNAAKFTTTTPKAGATAIDYLVIPADAIELVGTLATLRGKADDYTGRIVKAYATLAKTAQTTQDKSETSRRDTLDKDAKRKAFNVWVSKLFTVQESETSQIKKTMASMKELVAALKVAQKNSDTAKVAEITAAMSEAIA